MVKKTAFWLTLLAIACGQNQESWIPPKDEKEFKVPAEIVKIAPEMQDDLYALIRYASAYFPVKPEFVFREEGKSFVGNVQPFVTRLNLIHLVVYSGEDRKWSASLMFDPERGAAVNSIEGWSLDIVPTEQAFAVVWKNKEEVRYVIPRDQDDARWVEAGPDGRVFFYYYCLPSHLDLQGSIPGGKN